MTFQITVILMVNTTPYSATIFKSKAALGKQRQEDLCELEDNLVYIEIFNMDRTTQ